MLTYRIEIVDQQQAAPRYLHATVAGEVRARELAQREMDASPTRIAVRVWLDDELIFSLSR